MDSSCIASQFLSTFGTKNPYEILGLSTTASVTDEDIKKAYRKAALRNHPDKGGDAEKFKACCVAHSILSDKDKRAVYDETGDVDDANRDNSDIDEKTFAEWDAYFRRLYPKLTIQKIDQFSLKYKNSIEEKKDVINEYIKHKGKMKNIMACVILAEENDIERFLSYIDEAILATDTNGNNVSCTGAPVQAYPEYTSFRTQFYSNDKNILKKITKNVMCEEDSHSDEDTSSVGMSCSDSDDDNNMGDNSTSMNDFIVHDNSSKPVLKAAITTTTKYKQNTIKTKQNIGKVISPRKTSSSSRSSSSSSSSSTKSHGRKKSIPSAVAAGYDSSSTASAISSFNVDDVEKHDKYGVQSVEADLASSIFAAQNRRKTTTNTLLNNLENKYINKSKKGGRLKTNTSDPYNIDDAAFVALQKKMTKK